MAIKSIMEKEFHHILRDYRTLIILFAMPVIQMIIFGYALNMELQNIRIAIDDFDKSYYSHMLIRKFQGSKFFKISEQTKSLNILSLFLKNKIRAYITIPVDFSQKINSRQKASIDIMIDAANSNEAVLIKEYINSLILLYSKEILSTKKSSGIELYPVFRYNPEFKSSFFMVPGLLALLLIMITALLTSITLVREKESGTMVLLKISPLYSHEIILGKIIPYLFLSVIIATIILLVGIFLFDVPMRGNIFALYFFIIIYCLTGLGFGLFISSIAKTQQVAMLLALMATILPTLMLSGFIFPIESMPKILRYITNIIPAKYFLKIIRGIMIKNNSIKDLLLPAYALGGFSLFFIFLSVKKFSSYLEK